MLGAARHNLPQGPQNLEKRTFADVADRPFADGRRGKWIASPPDGGHDGPRDCMIGVEVHQLVSSFSQARSRHCWVAARRYGAAPRPT